MKINNENDNGEIMPKCKYNDDIAITVKWRNENIIIK